MQLALFRDLLPPALPRRFKLPPVYCYQGQPVEYTLIRQGRRKKMAIHVLPGGLVEVRVPDKCPNREIHQFVTERLEWILGAREKFTHLPAAESHEYIRGELHPFLGQDYLLDVVRGNKTSVQLTEDRILVSLRHPVALSDAAARRKVKKLLHDWYKQQALQRFPDLMAQCLASAGPTYVVSGLTVRKMKARWGSCSRDGHICLNSLLVKQAPDIIRYVIMHELCHLKHFHHQKAFYQLMDELMPQWRIFEKRLIAIRPENA
ncbi:MAG: M48 family metallopeptidase [Gammaproteobacteria bacterium]|nr:M48 family metallopeptidase [Gammaproteobacteria bacterium]